MPKRVKALSPPAVRALKEDGRYAVGGTHGLHLRIAGASRSWVLRIVVGSIRRDMGLGSFPEVSLAEARLAAAAAREKVRLGINPIEQRRGDAARDAILAAKSKTFKACAQIVIAQKKAALKNPKAAAQWESTLATYVYPTLASRIVGTITKQDIKAVLEPIWRTKHETASRLRGRIEAVFDYAKAEGCFEGDNPAAWKGALKPLLGEFKAGMQHFPSLPYADIAAFMVELRGREGVAARALEFAILTNARSGEVRGAVWHEIDLQAKHWTIPASRMKAGKEHRVPLSDDALSLLNTLPRFAGCDLLFPGARGNPMSDMSLTAVLRRMGRDAITVHGFRSSFRDWAGEMTAHPREVIEHALAHQLKDKAEAAYQRGTLLQKRAVLMSDWAKFVNTLPATDNVVDLSKRKRRA